MVSRLTLFSVVAAVAMALLGGCSGAGDRPPLADIENAGGAAGTGTVDVGGSSGSGGAGPVAAVCADGDTQKCKVKLPSQSGVNNCFVGVQLCAAGQWGPCSDPNDVRANSANSFGGAGGAR